MRWLRHAGDQVDERRLAGAVRSDQAEDFACQDVERNVLDGHNATKALGRLAHLQDRRRHTRCATRLRLNSRQLKRARVVTNSITPRGRNSTTSTTRSAKTTPCQTRNSWLLDARCSASWIPNRMNAPIHGPQTVPMPPIRQMMIICRLFVVLNNASAS